MQQKSGLSGWSARYFVSRETGRRVRIGFFWSGWHADRKFRAPGLSLFADFNRRISFYGGGVIKQR